MEQYDIFISYKRKSLPTANNLYYRLTTRGYHTFFDLEEMGRDNFNVQLLNYIENAKDVFVILEEGSLDACKKVDWEKDWFCHEIAFALEKKKNIIPILLGGFQMPSEDFFPDRLKELSLKNAPDFNFSFFEAYLDKLIEKDYLLSRPSLQEKATSVFKFYSNENCQVFKEGKLVCSLEGMSDEPYYLPVPRKGDYRFKAVNNTTNESQILNVDIDAVEEKNVEIKWNIGLKIKNPFRYKRKGCSILVSALSFLALPFSPFFDLAVCSVWMLSMFGGRSSWAYPTFLFVILEVLYRFVISFSLAHKEKRSWLPLLIFVPLIAMSVWVGVYNGIGDIIYRIFDLTKLEYNVTLKYALGGFLMLWLFVLPYVYYLYLLFRKQLVRTELTWKELVGGILWHVRLERTCSAMLMIMLVSFLTGLSMNARLCQIMCLTAAPLTYWLLCRYNKVKADKVWVLVVGMTFFWYAQILAGVWRVGILLVSFGLVIYVGTRLYHNIKNNLLVNTFVLYLGILLPSFCIGYNQYACINYARSGFYYLSPFQGILYITDSTRELYGLRDRYGLLVEPEYEHIREGEYIYILQKDGYDRYYDVYHNRFVHESDICPGLQREIRKILENHFKWNSEYDDKGQITVTELLDGKTIADVRISMYGNPSINYNSERFIPDDSITVSSGEFFRNDSVKIYHGTKHSLSYAINIPDDTVSRYRIYVRLATDSVPADSTLVELAGKVATLRDLK